MTIEDWMPFRDHSCVCHWSHPTTAHESSQLFSLFVTRSQVLGRDACALDAQGRGNMTAFKLLQREVKNWLPPIPYTGEFSPNGRGDGMLGSQKGKECPVQVQTGGGRGRKML